MWKCASLPLRNRLQQVFNTSHATKSSALLPIFASHHPRFMGGYDRTTALTDAVDYPLVILSYTENVETGVS
jgi:3',5'-cyclic AMP phosphodiesterase CpdA